MDEVHSDGAGCDLQAGSVIPLEVLGVEGPDGGPWLVRVEPYGGVPPDRGWFERPEKRAGWHAAATLVPLLGASRSIRPIDYANLAQLSDTTLIDDVLGSGRKVSCSIAPVGS